MALKVAVNGYGTIGKRVADAVSMQDDMKVVGVVKRTPTFEARMAVEKGYPFYAAAKEFVPALNDAGIDVRGTLGELLDDCDIVVDCTPKKAGYKALYERKKKKAIWQGGEKHELAGLSFCASANYEKALGADFARVVSCNTTGLCRTLYPLHAHFGIESVMAVMVRRSADPADSKKGPINAIEPEVEVPSHHGPDVQTVIPELNIQTTAVKVPTTIMHLHSLAVRLKQGAKPEDVIRTWEQHPRIIFVSTSAGIKSTAQVMEYARDMGRNRNDLYEIAVWRDGVHVADRTLYYYQAIHQEADVIPDNVDCIRAMCNIESDGEKSMAKTNRALGIGHRHPP